MIEEAYRDNVVKVDRHPARIARRRLHKMPASAAFHVQR
jgi:hypothetical protein